MRKTKTKVCCCLMIALLTSLVVVWPTTVAGQKEKKGRSAGRRVALKKDARKNGYTTKLEGTETYLEANDVEDPTTEELIEGLMRLRYRCGSADQFYEESLMFSKGRSPRLKLQCGPTEVAVDINE